MPFKDHVENTLRISPEPTPLFKMLLSSLTITTPLVIGFFTQDLFVSMFGSLMSLVLYLNDHFGNPGVRFKHLAVTFILLMISLCIGSYSVGDNYLIAPILFLLSFAVGKAKSNGIELERMMVFITLQFLTSSSESIFKANIESLLLYSVIAFVSYLFWATLIFKITKHQVYTMKSKRETLKRIISNNQSSFPFVCSIFSCLGFFIAHAFHFSHANWIVGTALIVMLPDSYQGIYKSAQRLFGTIIGVVMAAIILKHAHDIRVLLSFVFVLSFLIPHGLSKNYWVANIYIASLILLFLEIAMPQSMATHHLAFWRIIDIAVGSFIGVLAALWMRPSLILRRK